MKKEEQIQVLCKLRIYSDEHLEKRSERNGPEQQMELEPATSQGRHPTDNAIRETES